MLDFRRKFNNILKFMAPAAVIFAGYKLLQSTALSNLLTISALTGLNEPVMNSIHEFEHFIFRDSVYYSMKSRKELLLGTNESLILAYNDASKSIQLGDYDVQTYFTLAEAGIIVGKVSDVTKYLDTIPDKALSQDGDRAILYFLRLLAFFKSVNCDLDLQKLKQEDARSAISAMMLALEGEKGKSYKDLAPFLKMMKIWYLIQVGDRENAIASAKMTPEFNDSFSYLMKAFYYLMLTRGSQNPSQFLALSYDNVNLAIQSNPTKEGIYTFKSMIALLQGDLKKAKKDIDKIPDSDRNGFLYDYLMTYYYILNDSRENAMALISSANKAISEYSNERKCFDIDKSGKMYYIQFNFSGIKNSENLSLSFLYFAGGYGYMLVNEYDYASFYFNKAIEIDNSHSGFSDSAREFLAEISNKNIIKRRN